jgi:hypothetical protein
MDPFTQQIVSYPSEQVEVGSASVGRAQGYDSNLDITSLVSGLLVGPEFGMKSAIYNGIFTPGGATDLTPVCPSGNCTFPLFDSLAFCSKCLDVTKDVVNNDMQKVPEGLQGDYTISYPLPGEAVFEFGVSFSGGDVAMGPSMVSTTALPSDLSKKQFGIQNPLLTFAFSNSPRSTWNLQRQLLFVSSCYPRVHTIFLCQRCYGSFQCDFGLVWNDGWTCEVYDDVYQEYWIIWGGKRYWYAYKLETFVYVKWPWLTMPIALVALSILFLIATMILNSRKRALAWKSNSLALLFHGLEGVEMREAGEGVGRMDGIARRTRVRLARSAAGEWKLVSTG